MVVASRECVMESDDNMGEKQGPITDSFTARRNHTYIPFNPTTTSFHPSIPTMSSPLPKTTITHSKSGATAELYPIGATVTSFKTSKGRELIFLSRLAKLDGSKAVRGGIPLVFPQFAHPDKSMPQHGFFRTNLWTIDTSTAYDHDDKAGIHCTLTLSQVSKSRGGKWDVDKTDFDFAADYHVQITADTLTTVLTITNTGSTAFPFQTLKHTYFQVQGHEATNGETTNVTGLAGYSVEDKITNEEYVQDDTPIVFDKNVDRIYTPPADKPSVEAVVNTGGGTSIVVGGTGTVNGQSVPVSCVVWNPFAEKAAAMSDFGDDQYNDMVCVEPGIIQNVPDLEAGQACVFTQTVKGL